MQITVCAVCSACSRSILCSAVINVSLGSTNTQARGQPALYASDFDKFMINDCSYFVINIYKKLCVSLLPYLQFDLTFHSRQKFMSASRYATEETNFAKCLH